MEKKRILMVHNFYQIGGGEHTVFENEVKLLREHGHEVYTYTRSNDELKTSKAKLLLLPLSTIWSMGTYHQIRKQIREKQIDVVHCHNTFPLISPAVYYGARSLKVPVIQTIHNFRIVFLHLKFTLLNLRLFPLPYLTEQKCSSRKLSQRWRNSFNNPY